MPPFRKVRRHDDLRFQAVRQNAPRLLRRASAIQQIKIRRFCPLARIHPDLIAGCMPQSLRLNDRDLAAEAPRRVVTVACGFLAVRRRPMPHDLMTDAPVDLEQHRHVLMLKAAFRTNLLRSKIDTHHAAVPITATPNNLGAQKFREKIRVFDDNSSQLLRDFVECLHIRFQKIAPCSNVARHQNAPAVCRKSKITMVSRPKQVWPST